MAAAACRGAEARVLQQEMGRIGAWNPIGGMGVMMFGPTLIEYGTEEQKQRHIPPIARGEIRWCQGFSEPGAGSDLASLPTKCEDKGDHYLVNGQKIWTSGAQCADWCFCLVRTDTTQEARRHQLHPHRHALTGRRGAADPADQRQFAVLRDLLHRRQSPEGEPGRSAERRLDHRQAAAAARAQQPGRRRRLGLARHVRGLAQPGGQDLSGRRRSRAGSPIRSCAPASPPTRWRLAPSG